MKRLILLFVLGVCISQLVSADYLKLHRNTHIKSEPRSSAKKIKEIKEGELLILLDNGQQVNGYYHVQYPDSDIKGYIYRTLAKRIHGDFPNFPNYPEAVEVTVIDVDQGLSVLIKLPSNKYMVYDAGVYNRALTYIENVVEKGSEIEYLFLSHTDADHWGATKELVEDYVVKNVLRTDFRVTNRSQKLEDGIEAIRNTGYSIYDHNLTEEAIDPGTLIFQEGNVNIYFLMGFGELPEEWEYLSDSKQNNAVSIVIKIEYGDHAILLTGDAVGRKDGVDGCIASEKFMLDSLNEELLYANILIASHHGADNACCMDFIKAVSPEYVVFPSGHHSRYRHPRYSTAKRFYDDFNIPKSNIFRTDRHDKEPGGTQLYEREWDYPYTTTNRDIPGDDHVKIVMPLNGNIRIGYEYDN